MNLINKNLFTIPGLSGYIYFQLPHQFMPTSIWKDREWTDVTHLYNGSFFRVKDDEHFDELQSDSFPTISVIQSQINYNPRQILPHNNVTTLQGEWSQFVKTGGYRVNKRRTQLEFKFSNDEVRPRNYAIRIWKCSGYKNKQIIWTKSLLQEFDSFCKLNYF